jgi:hypothetical protein
LYRFPPKNRPNPVIAWAGSDQVSREDFVIHRTSVFQGIAFGSKRRRTYRIDGKTNSTLPCVPFSPYNQPVP